MPAQYKAATKGEAAFSLEAGARKDEGSRVVWDNHPQQSHPNEMKDQDSIIGVFYRARDGLAHIRGLRHDARSFTSDVCKGGRRHGPAGSKELLHEGSIGSSTERAGMLPVSKSFQVTVGSSAQSNHQRQYHEGKHHDQLDERHIVLDLARQPVVDVIHGHDDGQEDGDPHAPIDALRLDPV